MFALYRGIPLVLIYPAFQQVVVDAEQILTVLKTATTIIAF